MIRRYNQNGPRAASVHWPYPGRTMAEVIRDEEWGCFCEQPKRLGHESGCRVWNYGERRA